MITLKKYGIYAAFLINLGIILGFWWTTSHGLLINDVTSLTLAFGRLAGLMAVYFVLLQFLLMGRPMWIEKVFGLDKLARFHHINGYCLISLIVIHPTLLTISYARTDSVNLLDQILKIFPSYAEIFQAMIGAALFILIVFLSIYIVRKRLKYELWYYVHLLTYLAIVLVFSHQLKFGGDFGNVMFTYYWYALYIVVFGNVLIFRFARPVLNSLKYRFVVNDVVPETADTNSVYISGKNLEKFRSRPGQFVILRFLNKKFWWQAHPFSLSFVPKNNQLRVTIKNSGDFTSQVPTIKKGTPMYIDGPYGVFTAEPQSGTKYLFIAGGVGITPIRSLVEKVAPTNDVILLYGNKTTKDIIFKNELEEMAKKHRLTLHYIISDQPDYEGEKGRLDKEKIQRLVKDVREREVYICGPAPMLDSVRKLLQDRDIAVKPSRIHFEKFAL